MYGEKKTRRLLLAILNTETTGATFTDKWLQPIVGSLLGLAIQSAAAS